MRNYILILCFFLFLPFVASANYLKLSIAGYSDNSFTFDVGKAEPKNNIPFPAYVGIGFGNKKIYLEIEASYFQGKESSDLSKPSIDIFSAGLNLVLDFTNLKSKFNPFLGAGASGALYRPDLADDAYGLNKQFFAGINYSFTTYHSLGIEARHTSSIIDPDFGDDTLAMEAKFKQISYLLTTKFRY